MAVVTFVPTRLYKILNWIIFNAMMFICHAIVYFSKDLESSSQY